MSRFEAGLIFFGVLFIIIFIIDYFLIKRSYLKKLTNNKKKKTKKKNKNNELLELSYLINKFNLDKDKLPLNNLLIIISLLNSFIISLVSVVVIIWNVHMILKLLLGFILLLALIYSLYELLGRFLERRGYTK